MIEIIVEQRQPKAIPNWVRDPETANEQVRQFYDTYCRKVISGALDPKKDIREVALAYAEVFAGPPWNEFTRCQETDEYFGLDTKPGGKCPNSQACTECKGRLRLAYPLKTTTQYIKRDSQKESFSGITLKEGSCLAGFAWGYLYSCVEAFAKEKYQSEQMRRNLPQILQSCGLTDSFFYFSECGVRVPYRGKGLSNVLFQEVTIQARNLGLGIIMRTNWQSPMVAVAERFGMNQTLGPIVKADRVAEKFLVNNQLANNCQDEENNNRVLFILPSQ